MSITNSSITLKHKEYPALLKQIYNPPKILYYKGDITLLKKTCISVVGTRDFSDYGKMAAEKIIEELASLDIAIVSGLAYGIDSIAHKAALEFDLPTIAVLGSGIENIYPSENIPLAKNILKKGLIISEFPGDRDPTRQTFPQRNRIVSGLSVATIVVEAKEKSGALITAKLALEQGREIFVIPGDVDRENSLGPLRLLQNGGAYPVHNGEDIIEVLKRQPPLFETFKTQKARNSAKNKTNQNIANLYNLSENQKKILSILSRTPKTLEEINAKLKFSVSQLLADLSILEIYGIAQIKNGKYLQKMIKY